MCCGCQKSKTLSYFSQRQLDTARHVISRGGRPTSAKCIACFEMSTHKLEMQCKQCDKVLSLDDFSRSQRRDPDNAVSVYMAFSLQFDLIIIKRNVRTVWRFICFKMLQPRYMTPTKPDLKGLLRNKTTLKLMTTRICKPINGKALLM